EPLLRESMIDPGKSSQGMIILQFPISKDVWDRRRSAVLNVDLYHLGTQEVTIPQSTETAVPVSTQQN
ncbi:MAG TPA: hypothetical protein VNU92_03705, partial [Edaphobacter sp.]|nr:hypothetical protein [Edaphobacter sp.]